MLRRMVHRGVGMGATLLLIGSPLWGQQTVQVLVTAVPNPVSPGTCTGIWVEVRDASGQRVANVDGIQLYGNSYDYSVANTTDFAWKNNDPASGFLCVRAGAGPVSSPVTAVIRGTAHVGSTVVAVQSAPQSPVANAAVPQGPAPAPQAAPPPQYAQQPTAAGAVPPGQPYLPPAPGPQPSATGVSPPDPGIAAAVAPPPVQPSLGPPTQAYGPPASSGYGAAPAPAPGYQPAASPAPQTVSAPAAAGAAPAAPAADGGGGFFKKIGKHLKEKAGQVTSAAAENVANSATHLMDTTLQTGSGLVSGTVAGVSNTAQVTVGGAGKALLPSALRVNGSSDNLSLALGSGRAVLRAIRFDPATGQLTPASLALAQRVAAELRQIGAKWVIEAYVDPAPGDQELSEYRAAVVKTALIHYGVPRESLTALGYGPSKLEPETPAEGGAPTRSHIDIAKRE